MREGDFSSRVSDLQDFIIEKFLILTHWLWGRHHNQKVLKRGSHFEQVWERTHWSIHYLYFEDTKWENYGRIVREPLSITAILVEAQSTPFSFRMYSCKYYPLIKYTTIRVLFGPHIPVFRLNMRLCRLPARVFSYSV